MKINTIDLFAGCGGLCEGFEQSGYYNTLACVEWEKAPCNNLKKHLAEKWGYSNADEIVIRFDIQRTAELFEGWNDGTYGVSQGLNAILQEKSIDIIIGGPPCQAYSIAGRIRDKNGMRDDYRNFLFESYIRVVKQYKPKAFVFENVPGILSATPTGFPIIKTIQKSFYNAGYSILSNLEDAVIDLTQYGVSQKRNRIIILGLSNDIYGENAELLLHEFYNKILPAYKEQTIHTVREAIGDLPKLYPLKTFQTDGRRKYSHTVATTNISNHEPRWHSERDIKIFNLLASDIESGTCQYTSTTALKQLYTDVTGKKSNVHKYYVLRWDEPSNLIPAHLYKDGLRHIHPDSEQARTITVREAARLQGFPDDYEFIGTQADAYKMIGNAVPPIFSKKLACAIKDLLFTEE